MFFRDKDHRVEPTVAAIPIRTEVNGFFLALKSVDDCIVFCAGIPDRSIAVLYVGNLEFIPDIKLRRQHVFDARGLLVEGEQIRIFRSPNIHGTQQIVTILQKLGPDSDKAHVLVDRVIIAGIVEISGVLVLPLQRITFLFGERQLNCRTFRDGEGYFIRQRGTAVYIEIHSVIDADPLPLRSENQIFGVAVGNVLFIGENVAVLIMPTTELVAGAFKRVLRQTLGFAEGISHRIHVADAFLTGQEAHCVLVDLPHGIEIRVCYHFVMIAGIPEGAAAISVQRPSKESVAVFQNSRKRETVAGFKFDGRRRLISKALECRALEITFVRM